MDGRPVMIHSITAQAASWGKRNDALTVAKKVQDLFSLFKKLALGTIGINIIACSGMAENHPTNTFQPVAIQAQSSAVPAPHIENLVPVQITYDISKGTNEQSRTSKHRNLQYISSANLSLVIVVTPDGGSPMAPVIGSCTTSSCVVNLSANPGLNTIAFTLTDNSGGGGNILSRFTTMTIVQPGTINTFAFTANPVVNSVDLQLATNPIPAGLATNVALTINARDADNQIIVGPGNYVDANGNPVALMLSITNAQAGGTGTVTILGQSRIIGPNHGTISLHYDGRWLSSSTVDVTASGPIAGSITGITINTTAKVVQEYTVPTAGSVPWGIVTGNDGNIWFSEKNGNKVGRLTTAGVFTEYPIPTVSGTANEVALANDGNVWVTEQWGNKLARVAPSGAITEFVVPGTNQNVDGISSGPDGELWFVEFNGDQITKITTNGVYTIYNPNTLPAGLASITAGADGNLWFTQKKTNSIGKITTQGKITDFVVPTSASGLKNLTVGPDNNVWFTEQDVNKIARITPSGSITEYTVPTGGSQPWGLLTGPDGKIWFSEYGTNKIGNITTTGAFTEYSIPTANSMPYALTLGPDGNIWFTESNVNKIAKFVL